MLWLICNGKVSECEKAYIDKLLEYGYLKDTGGVIEPNVVIFRDAAPRCTAEVSEKLSALYKEAIAKKSPTVTRGYVIEQAIKDGWLIYSDDMIPSVGAFIYI